MKTQPHPLDRQLSILSLRPSLAGWVSVLLFLGSLAGYLATLTRVHTFDALSYALDVDTKPWQELFHPHHLAYGPLGALVGALAHTLGWEGSAVLPMQVTNAVAGAAGVALFFRLVGSITQRFDVALCGALLLGSSYAYWYYSVEVEVYTIAALFLIVCLWLLVRLVQRPTPDVCVALGLAQGLAVLFHQTNVLLCVPVMVALLLADADGENRQRWRWGLAYLLPLAGVVGGTYLLVGFGLSGMRSWAEFMAWNTAYARTGWWGGAITAENWSQLGMGLSSALAHPYGALLCLLLSGLLLCYLRHLVQSYRHLTLCLSSWLAIYGAFFFWWEPDNAEFWIASLPPTFLLLALALAAGKPRWHAGIWLVLAIALAMLAGNYDAVVKRGSGAYTPQRQITAALAAQSRPGDFVLVPDGLQKLYLAYYEGRTNTLSLSHVLQEHGGDWQLACGVVQASIEGALASGVAVFIGEGVLHPTDGVIHPTLTNARYGDPLLQRFRLEQEAVTDCFRAYIPGMVPLDLGAGMPTYYRLPSAQELLEGDGWDFAHSKWGWRAANIVDEQFVGGWNFLPLPDPHMTSPRVRIDTSRFWAVQVRLAKEVSNREGQLMLVDEQGIVEDSRSVSWKLAKHSEPKTYHLDMRDHPAWTGVLTGLRLDPVAGPDHDPGERVTVLWLRVLSYERDPPDPGE